MKNIKSIYILSLVFLIFTAETALSQTEKDIYTSDDYIVWGKQELTWNDFKGPVLSKDFNGTYGGFSFHHNIDGKWFAFAYFNKNRSWHNGESDKVLIHEKYHFNIVEIHARKLRKAIIENKWTMDSVQQINYLVKNLLAESASMQNLYDEETEHSKNRVKQKVWEAKIDEQLNGLKDYSSIIIN
jgi:hypothetical protein